MSYESISSRLERQVHTDGTYVKTSPASTSPPADTSPPTLGKATVPTGTFSEIERNCVAKVGASLMSSTFTVTMA
jgi:hypothetical protein